MMRLVRPSVVRGALAAPPSKSIAQRAIALAALAKGQSEILNQGSSDDVRSAIAVCRDFGVEIQEHPNRLIVNGGIKLPVKQIECGESGFGFRIFACIAATLNQPVTLSGKGTLIKRPMDVVEQSIRSLGAHCVSSHGYLPLTVTGPLYGGDARVDGSVTSQGLSGILMVAPLALTNSAIIVSNLLSKPYIDLTLDMMRTFGVEVDSFNYREFIVRGKQSYKPAVVCVEGDWSGAAFMLVAGAIAGSIRVEGLNPMSKQPDRAILDILIWVGAKVSIQPDAIEVSKQNLEAFHFDATHCPDLFPPLVALAAHCKGESRILGAGRLKHKESDRAATLKSEFAKLGIDISIDGDLMRINGGKVQGGNVCSHSDHRIAMACTVAALCATAEVQIEQPEVVDKSYPSFFSDIAKLQSNF
jgi:3-phosphoshikimate 1-carboxyvinyltransferase